MFLLGAEVPLARVKRTACLIRRRLLVRSCDDHKERSSLPLHQLPLLWLLTQDPDPDGPPFLAHGSHYVVIKLLCLQPLFLLAITFTCNRQCRVSAQNAPHVLWTMFSLLLLQSLSVRDTRLSLQLLPANPCKEATVNEADGCA